MLAWMLLSLLAADEPARGLEKASGLCQELATAACDYRSRCSKDWNPHDALAFTTCRKSFDVAGCIASLDQRLADRPESEKEVRACAQQLYPENLCVYVTDDKMVECTQRFDFLSPEVPPRRELVDARPPPEEPEPPQPPDVKYPWLFPLQASISAVGELNSAGTTFGGNFYVGWAGGRVILDDAFADKEGPFVGVGLAGFFGTTDIPDCGPAVRCGYRSWLGPGVRLGWAQWNRRKLVDRLQQKGGHNAGNVIWPDTYYFVQVTPFFGGEHLPSAPLAPAETALLHGVRFDLGVNSIELTRTIFHILSEVMSGSKGDAAAVALFLLPLALLNHLEFNVEWSNPALSPGGWRVGVSMGAGF